MTAERRVSASRSADFYTINFSKKGRRGCWVLWGCSFIHPSTIHPVSTRRRLDITSNNIRMNIRRGGPSRSGNDEGF